MTAILRCTVCGFEVLETQGWAQGDRDMLAHMNEAHPAPKKRQRKVVEPDLPALEIDDLEDLI